MYAPTYVGLAILVAAQRGLSFFVRIGGSVGSGRSHRRCLHRVRARFENLLCDSLAVKAMLREAHFGGLRDAHVSGTDILQTTQG